LTYLKIENKDDSIQLNKTKKPFRLCVMNGTTIFCITQCALNTF